MRCTVKQHVVKGHSEAMDKVKEKKKKHRKSHRTKGDLRDNMFIDRNNNTHSMLQNI